METTTASKIKEEPNDDWPTTSFIPTVIPSQGLIEYFLDHDYKRDDMNYSSNKVNCLDENDGKFKCFTDLSANHTKTSIEGDFKNYCSKCNELFDNLLAAQNHYIFNHPCSSMLTKSVQAPNVNVDDEDDIRNDYNWLEEPIQPIVAEKHIEKPSNIIVIKTKEEYLKKLDMTKSLVRVTEVPCENRVFTLEGIKAHPQVGIKVVKKAEIKFDQLKVQAQLKSVYSKKPEPQTGEAPPKKVYESERQLIKIDISEAFKENPNLNDPTLTKPLCLGKQCKKNVTYFCRRCNLEMYNPFVYDTHIKRCPNTTFSCVFCGKAFCTKMGIMKHIEICKKIDNKTNVKIVRINNRRYICMPNKI